MELFGKTELSTSEFADSLSSRLCTERPIEIIIAPVVTAFVVWLFWRSGSQVT